MRPTIFVSYSHNDGNLVGPLVQLLRASAAHVFRDADGIQAGKKWREQLSAAITDARLVMVFWCDHASASEEVKKEYSAAIEQGKDVLPVLIDDTPLPRDLAEYQYIDFRGVFPGGHGFSPPIRPAGSVTLSVARAESSSAWRWIAASIAGFCIIGAIAYLFALSGIRSIFDRGLVGAAPNFSGGGRFAAMIAVVVAILVSFYLVLRKRAHNEESRPTRISNRPSSASMSATGLDPRLEQLCQKIDTELRRRIPVGDS